MACREPRVASLLYGTGMRLLEGLRLRVKDIEFERREVLVRSGNGGKDRVTVLPENLVLPLQQQIAKVRAMHQRDLDEGFGNVWLPHALAVKYPNAAGALGWQWVFPSAKRAKDSRTEAIQRHHLCEVLRGSEGDRCDARDFRCGRRLPTNVCLNRVIQQDRPAA